LGALSAGIFWVIIGHPKDRLAIILTIIVFVLGTFFMAGDHIFPAVGRLRKRFGPDKAIKPGTF